MVAQVGEAAISAVSLVDTVNVLLVNAFSALATGGAVIAGQYLGRREQTQACHAGEQLLLFMGEASLVVTVLFYLGRSFVLGVVFGQVEPDVAAYANTYYLIVEASTPFLAIYSAGAALFRVMGNSGISMWVSMLMNTLNVAGNALLVFCLHWGVEGVAIPTLISRAVAAVVIVVLLRRPDLPLRVQRIPPPARPLRGEEHFALRRAQRPGEQHVPAGKDLAAVHGGGAGHGLHHGQFHRQHHGLLPGGGRERPGAGAGDGGVPVHRRR